MADFFNSTFGAVLLAAAGVLLFFIVIGIINKGKLAIREMTFGALMIAIAVALSFVAYPMPYGGSLTLCSMFFVILIGWRHGPGPGLAGAVAYGLLHFAIKPYFYHPIQFFLDYILAFGALGVSGFFRNSKLREKQIRIGKSDFGTNAALILAVCIPMLLRMMFSTISGVVFFAEYAPEGMNPLVYSILYNGFYIISEMLITLALISIPVFRNAIRYVEKV